MTTVGGSCRWLNNEGRLEADVTVTKARHGAFLVVVTDSMHRHAETWLRDRQRVLLEECGGQHCTIVDVTEGYSLMSVQGPRSRELLQQLTDSDLCNESLPFGASKQVYLGAAQVRLTRITYVGERLTWVIGATAQAATAG